MKSPRYVTKLIMRQYIGPEKSGSLEILPVKFDWKGKPIFNKDLIRSFEFSIKDTVAGKEVAYIDLGKLLEGRSTISSSREDSVAALKFYKTFKQSPFRLLLFASLSFMEKIGDKEFRSDVGELDAGKAHNKQLRQRLFFESEPMSTRTNFHDHTLGFFPRLSFSELDKILRSDKVVPLRLLPPESVLRKVRAKSYATLKFGANKEKYKTARKAKSAKMIW